MLDGWTLMTTDVLVGDHVEVAGLGIGIVTSIWGSFASVDFRGESRHINLRDLSSVEARQRQRQVWYPVDAAANDYHR